MCGEACKKTSHDAVLAPPRLLVVVVVDQLRGDEIATYGSLWHDGFRTLRDEGRWYTHAFHTHGRTETAAGHATLATGELPRWHGVVDKTMYVRARHKVLNVCDFGAGPCSADALAVPTLGDRLKAKDPAAKVVSLSEKARSAALLGGKTADLVAWHSDDQIALVGRQSRGPGLPPWLNLFFARVAAPDRIARMWELPRLPEPFRQRPGTAAGQQGCGHGATFPHRLTAKAGPELVSQWHCTPDSDRVVSETALFVARHLDLGKDDVPDILWVSFSAVDVIGHAFGTDSIERVAVLTELDRQLGDLIDGLREQVGPRLLVALSADHGVAPRVASARAMGHSSGRVNEADLVNIAEAALYDAGPGPHVAALAFPFLHLADNVPDRPQAAAQVAAALRHHPEVFAAWSQKELASDSTPLARLMQANNYPERSGDVVIVLKEFFAPGTSEAGATHGTPWDYDRHVPVMLWGDGVHPGKVDENVAVIDMVRTLSDRLGLPADPHGGKPLP